MSASSSNGSSTDSAAKQQFMSTLLSQLPHYVLQALASGQQCKLDCLAQLLPDPDVLAAMLSQRQPEVLLDALHEQHLEATKQQQQHQQLPGSHVRKEQHQGAAHQQEQQQELSVKQGEQEQLQGA
jgi:hypothetical protein